MRFRNITRSLLACATLVAAALPCAAQGAPYSVTLLWTAPGDDGDVGRATRYDLRYSAAPVGADVASWWAAARSATGLPRPSSAGQSESATVTGLTPATSYSFVLRTYDEVGNVSGFSNVAVAVTDSAAAGTTPPSETGPLAAVHAYPNPATDQVHFVIHVEDPADQRVQIRLFDLTGHLVADIADGTYPSGDTTVSWPRLTRNGDRVAPGYYETIGTIGPFPVRERVVLLP